MFSDVYLHYVKKLRNSTRQILSDTQVNKCKKSNYYNYIILNASKCNQLLSLLIQNEFYICSEFLNIFKQCCIYIGKGTNRRKFDHVVTARNNKINDHNQNSQTIQHLWNNKEGIMVFHFPNEVNHYEAHSREFALIKAVGLNKLNNVINGTAYGSIQYWNETEIHNFGNMMLYNAIKICVNDPPPIIMN